MQPMNRFRIPALFCALCVLVCELIAHPFANMGVDDDWPYIIMVHHLATTGHIVYNGWAGPMLGWQLYLGAAFIKLFGFSFPTVRNALSVRSSSFPPRWPLHCGELRLHTPPPPHLRRLLRPQRLLRPCTLRSHPLLPLAPHHPEYSLRRPLHTTLKTLACISGLLS